MIAAPLRLLWFVAVLLVGAGCLATLALIAGRLTLGEPAAHTTSLSQMRDLAHEAGPLVASLERYRGERGIYPAKPSDLDGRLPQGALADSADDGISFDTGGGAIWVYSRDDDGKGFDLERHLADGGILTLSTDATGKVWTYAASDDDEPKPLDLAP